MVEARARKIHNVLRGLAQSPSKLTVQHKKSDGGHCDVCRREICIGEMEHIVTSSFARVCLDDVCLVIWTRERDRFAAEHRP